VLGKEVDAHRRQLAELQGRLQAEQDAQRQALLAAAQQELQGERARWEAAEQALREQHAQARAWARAACVGLGRGIAR